MLTLVKLADFNITPTDHAWVGSHNHSSDVSSSFQKFLTSSTAHVMCEILLGLTPRFFLHNYEIKSGRGRPGFEALFDSVHTTLVSTMHQSELDIF